MGKLFGTDGIRGIANQYPVTAEMAMAVGKAIVHVFRIKNRKCSILIGRDTRISGPMLEHALASGVASMGGHAIITGVVPAPAVAYLTRKYNADAGIAISASHNPYEDNGIKVFGKDGFKITDRKEDEIEAILLTGKAIIESSKDIGTIKYLDNGQDIYGDFCRTLIPSKISFNKYKLIIDCANGATSGIATKVFSNLGAQVTTIGNTPNGININKKCGSEYPQHLVSLVKRHKADAGFAFDGDGDRLIAVDDKGRIVNGDRVMFICATYLASKRRLLNNLLITTTMSNMGLRVALDKHGIKHIDSAVGDRKVLELMLRHGSVFGGEQSGHLIFLHHQTTGDGIVTAIQLLNIIKESGQKLSNLGTELKIFPQIMINVPVDTKPPIEDIPTLTEEIRNCEQHLGKESRIFVRYSGTQPFCRVMVEGKNKSMIKTTADHLAKIVRKYTRN